MGSFYRLYFFILFLCFSCSFIVLAKTNTSNPINRTSVLITNVCKNSTNQTFCEEVLYSDPRAPTEDPYLLAYIAFGLAYSSANTTSDQIKLLLKGNESDIHLRKCQDCYDKALHSIASAISDLDSETYSDLGDQANEAYKAASDCENAIDGTFTTVSPMNQRLMGISEICGVISKLFVALIGKGV